MEKVRYMISAASSLANVESHVLRYWEEECQSRRRKTFTPNHYNRNNV